MSFWDGVKTYGGYALDPVGIVTKKKMPGAPDPLGLSQDTSDAPQLEDPGYKGLVGQLQNPNANGLADPTQVAQGHGQLIGNLAGAVYGNAPSVAQAMLTQATDANQRAALGNAAAGVSGGNAALALRAGQQAAAQAGQQAAGQAAGLRATEIAQARQQLGSELGGDTAAIQGNTQQQLGAINGLGQLQATNAALKQNALSGAQNRLGSAGSTALSLISDERAKEDVHAENPHAIDAFLGALKPVGFEYIGTKEPEHGVIAQDVEKGGPIGKRITVDMGGLKGIDIPRAIGALLQAVGRLNQKVEMRHG